MMGDESLQTEILKTIDRFIELRRSEWGNIHVQVGEFNPTVTRYDMLQKFRKSVERGDLQTYDLPDGMALEQQVFQVWKQLATQAVGEENLWGHPIGLSKIYGHLPFHNSLQSWDEFLQALAKLQNRVDDTRMEFVPSRSKNWQMGDRSVGAVTFHPS
jgi:hypothetical protein